jgi:hypothetical protein
VLQFCEIGSAFVYVYQSKVILTNKRCAANNF